MLLDYCQQAEIYIYKFDRRVVLDGEGELERNVETAQRHDQEEEADLILTTAEDSIEQEGGGDYCVEQVCQSITITMMHIPQIIRMVTLMMNGADVYLPDSSSCCRLRQVSTKMLTNSTRAMRKKSHCHEL